MKSSSIFFSFVEKYSTVRFLTEFRAQQRRYRTRNRRERSLVRGYSIWTCLKTFAKTKIPNNGGNLIVRRS